MRGAEQQATGLSQVNAAIQEMDQGIQKNAAMVEQSAAAVHALAKEADTMAELTAQFGAWRNRRGSSSRRTQAYCPPCICR